MSDYGHYVAYRNASEETRARVERTPAVPDGPRRTSRQALARRLHNFADRLDG